MSTYDKIHFGIIRFVHETLYGLLVNPYSMLSLAGLKPGQKVVEVGCGPGFFTLPAARIVGDGGHVYALDINPAAVQYVSRKIKRARLTNIEVMQADASQTGLPDESVDLVFLFGVVHALNLNEVLREMNRVLKLDGILSVQSKRPEAKLLEAVTADGLFDPEAQAKGVFTFKKARKQPVHGATTYSAMLA